MHQMKMHIIKEAASKSDGGIKDVLADFPLSAVIVGLVVVFYQSTSTITVAVKSSA